MRAYDLIAKKRQGRSHTREELEFLVRGAMDGSIPDYQLAAWLMAVTLRGMDRDETWALTGAMANSGVRLRLPGGPKLDKHSTGGVGDTTTLAVVPLVAALGVPVVKLSGRGLGHTGGTIDKLEAIPGLRLQLDAGELGSVLDAVGMVIASQSRELAPADGLFYELRDVTATVDSIPLIAASIMAKKLAAGADAVVLDVKTGAGALLPTLAAARELSRTMVEVGSRGGLRVHALLTDMEEPLGPAVGNALEVAAAVRVLSGEGAPRLTAVCLALAAEMAWMGGAAATLEESRRQVLVALDSGAGRARLAAWVAAQGGDARVIEDPDRLPRAECERPLRARRYGFVTGLNAREVGLAAVLLGAGRARKGERVDPAAGITIVRPVGAEVRVGEVLALLSFAAGADADGAAARLEAAFAIGPEPVEPRPPVLEAVR